jgi:hypothetical protein
MEELTSPSSGVAPELAVAIAEAIQALPQAHDEEESWDAEMVAEIQLRATQREENETERKRESKSDNHFVACRQ